jgi:predicted permease
MIGRDLRFGLRLLRKNPLFTVVAILSLALGIGANTAFFTFANALFLRPQPAVDPRGLVWVFGTDAKGSDPLSRFRDISYPNYLDVRDQNRVFSGLTAFRWLRTTMSSDGGDPEIVRGELVSGNYFEVLGIEPSLGRTLRREDEGAPGTSPVVVLSHGLWQRRFGGDPGIVGKTLLLNNHAFTVVGVAAEGYLGPYVTYTFEFWVPASAYPLVLTSPQDFADRGKRMFTLIGRLRPGVGREQAQAELATLAGGLAAAYRAENEGVGVNVVPFAGMHPFQRETLARIVSLLMAVVGLVLLIACANVANLLLARAMARGREMAVRQAMGADRRRLFGQALVEGLLLATLGGAVGLLFALWGRKLLWQLEVPFLAVNSVSLLDLDVRVLAFALLLSLATTLAFGLLPALRASRSEPVQALKGQTPEPRWGRPLPALRHLLVVAQVALSMIALVGAGLFLRSLEALREVDLGYDPDRLLTVSFDLAARGFGEAESRAAAERLMSRVAGLPGVAGAALAEHRPLYVFTSHEGLFVEGRDVRSEREAPPVFTNRVGPGYFATLGLLIVQGRPFEASEHEQELRVAVINQTMARRCWPDENPIGKRFRFGEREPFLTVVGVARDSRYHQLREAEKQFVYLPLTRYAAGEMTLHVRADGDPAPLLAPVRRAVLALDPSMPLRHDETLASALEESLTEPRTIAALLTLLGLLALALAAGGTYGVLTYTVHQRTHEMGVRMAMGARPSGLLRLVLRQSLGLIASGVALGAVAAVALTRLISGLLFGVQPFDPQTFVASALLLAAVGLAASLLPARRAARVDPALTLRLE